MELCQSTKIMLLEAKIAVLESALSEYVNKEQLAARTKQITDKYLSMLNGVQHEYPGHTLDNNFNLVELEKKDVEIPKEVVE